MKKTDRIKNRLLHMPITHYEYAISGGVDAKYTLRARIRTNIFT